MIVPKRETYVPVESSVSRDCMPRAVALRFGLARAFAPNARGSSRRPRTVSRDGFQSMRGLPNSMDFPSDGVTLAGDLSPEDVARALETGGVKSWIYMNAESNPAFPKQAKTTLGERFKTVIVDPLSLIHI